MRINALTPEQRNVLDSVMYRDSILNVFTLFSLVNKELGELGYPKTTFNQCLMYVHREMVNWSPEQMNRYKQSCGLFFYGPDYRNDM